VLHVACKDKHKCQDEQHTGETSGDWSEALHLSFAQRYR
jgi:hypothetical protein